MLQAHDADAIGIDVLKAGQQRIALAKAGAERQLADAQASEEHLQRQLDRVLALLGQAHQHYLASTGQARRFLNQGVFERICLDDDEVVGSDLTQVFQQLFFTDLDESLASERRIESRRSSAVALHLVSSVTETHAWTSLQACLPPATVEET